MAKQSKVQKWNLNDLHPHPRQAEIFGDMKDGELELLAADIERNGLERPVEIRPNGQIISGHQRVRAFRLLGRSEIDVVIRYDLEKLGEWAITLRFVDDNAGRRQLDPFSVVLCAVERMQQFEHGSEWAQHEAIVAEIQKRTDLGPRNINRYLAAAKAPLAVQEAFKRGRLSLVLASQVSGLPPDVKQQAASRIIAGENPRSVVRELVEQHKAPRLGLTLAFGPFVRRLKDVVKMTPDSSVEITGYLLYDTTLETLEEAVKKLTALKRRLKRKFVCESEGDRETKESVAALAAEHNGKEHRTDAPTTSADTPAKTRKRRAKTPTKRAGLISKNKTVRTPRDSQTKSRRKSK